MFGSSDDIDDSMFAMTVGWATNISPVKSSNLWEKITSIYNETNDTSSF